MASWTRSALALIASTPGAQALVEAAHPGAGRIAACHVISWSRLCKQWTRSAIRQAESLPRAARKMVELSAHGLHVGGHHVSHHPHTKLSHTPELLTPPPQQRHADPKPQPSTPANAAPITMFTIKDFAMWDVDEIQERLDIETIPAWMPIGQHMNIPCLKLCPSIPTVLIQKSFSPMPA